jgi:hypothetical protein
LKAIDDDAVAEDVVGLLVMYLFTTILFPQASEYVPIHMFHYAEDVNKLCSFAWGETVYELLMDNIPFCSIWCHLMEKSGCAVVDENSYDDELDYNEGDTSERDSNEGKNYGRIFLKKNKTMKKHSGCLSGYTLALIVSFYIITFYNSY